MTKHHQSHVDYILASFANIIEEIKHMKRYAIAMLDDAGQICKSMIDQYLDAQIKQRSSDSIVFIDVSSQKIFTEFKDSLIAIKKMISGELWWAKIPSQKDLAKTQGKKTEATKRSLQYPKLKGKSCRIETNSDHTQKPAARSHNTNMNTSSTPAHESISKPQVPHQSSTHNITNKQTKSVLESIVETMPAVKQKPTLPMEVQSMAASKKLSAVSTAGDTIEKTHKKYVGHSDDHSNKPNKLSISTAASNAAFAMDNSNVYSVKSKNIKSEQSEITHVHMMPDHQILILRDTMAIESKSSVKGKSVYDKSDVSQSVKDNISGQYTLYLFRKNEDTAFFNFIVEDGNEPVQVSGVELIDEKGQPTIHLLLVLRSKAKEQLVMNYILVTAKRFKGLIFLKDFQVGEPCYLRTRVQENSFDILLLNDRTSLICFRFSRTTIDWYNKLKDKNAKLKMLRDEPPGGEVIDFHHAKPLNSEPISRVAILVQWPESEQNKAYRAMIVIATLDCKDSQGLLTFNVE